MCLHDASFVVISAIVLIIAACGGGGGSGATAGDMLARIKKDGVIRVGTDPNYAPQSFQKPDGTFEGFDVDVANEIAKRLGVTAKFETPDFERRRGRQLGRPLRHQRRLDDHHRGAQGRARLHRAVLLHAGPDGGHQGHPASPPSTAWPARRSASARRRPTTSGSTGTLELGRWLRAGARSRPAPTATTLRDRPGLRPVGQVRPPRLRRLAELVDDRPAGHRRGHAVRHGRRPGLLRAARGRHRQGRRRRTPSCRRSSTRSSSEMHADGTLSTLSEKWFDGQDLTTKQ